MREQPLVPSERDCFLQPNASQRLCFVLVSRFIRFDGRKLLLQAGEASLRLAFTPRAPHFSKRRPRSTPPLQT